MVKTTTPSLTTNIPDKVKIIFFYRAGEERCLQWCLDNSIPREISLFFFLCEAEAHDSFYTLGMYMLWVQAESGYRWRDFMDGGTSVKAFWDSGVWLEALGPGRSPKCKDRTLGSTFLLTLPLVYEACWEKEQLREWLVSRGRLYNFHILEPCQSLIQSKLKTSETSSQSSSCSSTDRSNGQQMR